MKNTALLIVDMVRDFTDPEGLVFYPQNREILPRIRRVLDKCREKDCLIVFLQHCNRKGKEDRRIASMRPNCIEGTPGIEIDPMLPVDEEKDYVIRKRRYSGFFGTDLDLVLRENHIENLIIVGTKTNCCIRATVTTRFIWIITGSWSATAWQLIQRRSTGYIWKISENTWDRLWTAIHCLKNWMQENGKGEEHEI